MYPQEACTAASLQYIDQCAQELRSLGIFTQNSFDLSSNYLRARSKDIFMQICNAYKRFALCIEPYKRQCMYSQVMMQYRLATEALEYVCNEGLYGMLKHWDCLVKVMASREVIGCENEMIRNNGLDTSYPVHSSADERLCRNLKEYMQCTQYPVTSECGDEAWNEFAETAKRQTRVILPFCTLASFRDASSALIISVSLVMTYLWKVYF